jgi:FAD synthetase
VHFFKEDMERKKAMVFGTFDTVHKGHEYYVAQAKKYGDVVIVVARDSNVKKFKKCLIHDENERFSHVEKSFPDCQVILGNEDNPHRIVQEYLPDVICLGYDQRSFEEGLSEKFPQITIVRLKALRPDIYKTSKILPPCDLDSAK